MSTVKLTNVGNPAAFAVEWAAEESGNRFQLVNPRDSETLWFGMCREDEQRWATTPVVARRGSAWTDHRRVSAPSMPSRIPTSTSRTVLRPRVIQIPSSTRLEESATKPTPVRYSPGSRYGPAGHCR